MKKSILALTIATAFSVPVANSTEVPSGVTSNIVINGGGAVSVLQEGVGASSANFSTSAGGSFDGSNSVSTGHSSVQTSAHAAGNVWSTTSGTVTGNAAGYNFSNANLSGSSSVDGSVNVRGNSFEAGSTAGGSAGAGSAVNLGPNAAGVTTSGSSFQQAGFEAYNTSKVSGRVVENEYCDVPTEVSLYAKTTGATAASASGVLTGTGASGSSAALGIESGYADGKLGVRSEYLKADMTTSVDGESFSYANNANGVTKSAAVSTSKFEVEQKAKTSIEGCCKIGETAVTVSDVKKVTGTVIKGSGQAGGEGSVEFKSDVTSTKPSTNQNHGGNDHNKGKDKNKGKNGR